MAYYVIYHNEAVGIDFRIGRLGVKLSRKLPANEAS